MIKRRTLLAAGAATLAAPGIVAAQGTRVLKFVPQADVTVLDPIWTTAYVTRNHGYMVFDTLFGSNGKFEASPQMAEGMTVENDGKLVRIRLRDGLKFHDGTPVLARDCVASIQRWGKRDTYGQTLLSFTDELSAPDDKTIQFRLKAPFPLLPDALAKPASNFAAMMPERLAKTDAFTQITEMVGSGPFRFNAKERVVGSQVVYERFADYKPRDGGTPDWTAGPKIVNFDRVEWRVIPDSATAAGALQNNEVDWWENPPQDLVPLLKKNSNINVFVQDPTGQVACMRLNHLNPPFDNPAIRRAVLKAISQTDYEQAVVGDDPSMFHVPTGVFCPGTPMASDAGLEVFQGPRDYAAAKKAIMDAGYKGEKVVLMAPTDFPILKALADVGADVLTKCRPERRLPGVGLGFRGHAPGQEGPGGPGRLEPVPHVLGRWRPTEPGRPRLPARPGTGHRHVRLADQPGTGNPARPVDRGAGPGIPEEDRRRPAAAGVGRCALHPAWAELLQHRPPQEHHGRPERIRNVLERAAGVAGRVFASLTANRS